MNRPRRIAWFIVVGCTAAAVHLGSVVLLVEALGTAPLIANVAGWLLAFAVSFTGQSQLTFRGRGTPWTAALPRFFALSLGGFLLNEGAYALLLRWTALRYDVALGMVLVMVAILTYLLGSRWVFRRSPAS